MADKNYTTAQPKPGPIHRDFLYPWKDPEMNTYSFLICPPCEAAKAAAEQVTMAVAVLVFAGIVIFLIVRLVLLAGRVKVAKPAEKVQPADPSKTRTVDHSAFWADKLPPVIGENGQVFRSVDHFNPDEALYKAAAAVRERETNHVER